MNPLLLSGMEIRVSPLITPIPKIKMSPTFTHCTSKAREEMDSWLLARFGLKENIIQMGNTIFVSPAVFKQLMEYKNEQKHQGFNRLY